jgi:hypothetical protein
MALWTGLFASRCRKDQQQIAARVAQVIEHVLFDVGVDRFVNGTLLLDRKFRLRFFGSTPTPGPDVIAQLAVRQLPEARAFRELVDDVMLDSATLDLHSTSLVRAVMLELKAQSPALRALP